MKDLTEVAQAGYDYLRVTDYLMNEINTQIELPEAVWLEDVKELQIRIQRCKKCYMKLTIQLLDSVDIILEETR